MIATSFLGHIRTLIHSSCEEASVVYFVAVISQSHSNARELNSLFIETAMGKMRGTIAGRVCVRGAYGGSRTFIPRSCIPRAMHPAECRYLVSVMYRAFPAPVINLRRSSVPSAAL